MKYKKLMLVSLFLLIVFTLGAASAADDNGTTQISEGDSVEVDANDDLKIVSENQELADENEALSNEEKANLDFEIKFAKEIFREEGGEGHLVVVDTISPDYDGTFNISIDGNAAEKYCDGYKLHAGSFNVGLHNITVVSQETEKYNPTSKTTYFNVTDILIIIPSEIVVGSNDYIKAYVAQNMKGTLTVNVDGKEFEKIDLGEKDIDPSSGHTIRLNGLDFKRNYMIEVIYSGNYPSTSKKVNVTAIGYEIFAYVPGFFYMSGRNYVHVELPKDAKGKPTVLVDGIQYACEKNGTEYVADVNSLGIGQYNLTVGYEDEKYPYYEITEKFSVNPKIDYQRDVYYGSTNNITLRLPKNASGQLKVYISDEYIYSQNESMLYKCVKLEDGMAAVSLSDFGPGMYSIYAVYDGDDYNVYPASYSLNVKMNIIYPYEITYGDAVDITVISHQNDNSKLVLIISDRDKYLLQLVNGTAKLQLKKLPAYDSIDFRIYYATSDSGEFNQHHPIDSFSIWVNPKKPKMTLAKDISMYYNDGSKYSVKVYDGFDRPVGANYHVVFKIGTTKYNRQTDANGVATLVIPKLPGTYKISATCLGVTVKNKLTVKKVLTLTTVKVKKSAKKLVLSATLKKGKKPIKNTKVTFKFNGKTYSAKTNSKGIAKYTIKKSVLKKLKAGKKVTYQVTYKKCTVKKTATVKK